MRQDDPNRPDVDIEEDINSSLRDFSPLKAARGFFRIQSTSGNVTVSGNVGSPQAKHMLRRYVLKTSGVSNVDMSNLYDDEQLRLNIGGMIPDDILVSVHFGNVVLNSRRPDGHQETLRRVRSAAGIRKVVMGNSGIKIEG
jgi:BON domain